MDSVYSALATRALQKHECLRNGKTWQRTIIALAGPPGSGKSTLAAAVVELLNKQTPSSFAVVVPMDGFHLSRKALDEFPNKAEAHARRGAAWTFDAHGVVNLVKVLHNSKKNVSEIIFAPNFDHLLKDPCENGITITPESSIIILEGNWLLFDEDPWRQISSIVEDTWFVDVDAELAKERIARRHVRSGIEATLADAIKRAESNDLLNGNVVRTKLIKPAITVQSLEFPKTRSDDETPLMMGRAGFSSTAVTNDV